MAHECLLLSRLRNLKVTAGSNTMMIYSGPILHLALVLQEGRRPLVHPRMTLLIGPYDHRDPHVPDLVSSHVVQITGLLTLIRSHYRHHRELHPTLYDVLAFNRSHVGPRVRIGCVFGMEFDSLPTIPPLFCPERS